MNLSTWNRMPQLVLDQASDSIWGVFDLCGGTLGTAFVVRHNDTNYLITSLHVIRGFNLKKTLDKQLKISRAEIKDKISGTMTQELKSVKLIFADDISDIAIITADDINSLPALNISDYSDQRIRVFSIGLAQAVDYFGMSITEGIISNPDKEVVVGSRAFKQTHIEHTAPLVGGQSGGPMVDMKGNVVGVNSFARGQRGLHLYYSTPLSRVLDRMTEEGRLEIQNTGVARIKSISITPAGEKPAEIDRLPREIGKVNGNRSVRFSMREGHYLVTLQTEEKKPFKKEIEIKAGEKTLIEYSFGRSGLRITNKGCQKILSLSLLNPLAEAMMEKIIKDKSQSPPERAERIRKLLLSQDILEKDTLAPGQTWVEWVTDWDYTLFSFTWDPLKGEFIMPDPREVKVNKYRVTDILLTD